MPSGMGLIRIKKKDPAELSVLAGEGYSKRFCVIPRGKPIPDTSRNGSRWHKRWEGWSHREAEDRGGITAGHGHAFKEIHSCTSLPTVCPIPVRADEVLREWLLELPGLFHHRLHRGR